MHYLSPKNHLASVPGALLLSCLFENCNLILIICSLDCSLIFLPLSHQQLMTVRTITGNIYYARSGTKIVGKVHEKFTLIDGIRVATGSYR